MGITREGVHREHLSNRRQRQLSPVALEVIVDALQPPTSPAFPIHCSEPKDLKRKMPQLVFHYFGMPFWRAEVSRLALHLGKVDFEDRIITDRKAWVETGVSPFGQAPLLEVDGKPIAQTGAIARYC